MKSTAALATMLVVLGAPRAARADDAHDKAISSFKDGRAYVDAGNCDAAVTKLKESIAYEPSVGARLSLADCYEKSDTLAAWRALKEAASLAFVNHDERLGTAEARASALEKKLPTIRVSIPASALELPGFELRIDGEVVDRFWYRGGIVAVKPGKHVVEAAAPLRHFSQAVQVEPDTAMAVNVALERDACPNPAATTTTLATSTPAAPVQVMTEPSSSRRTLGLTLGAVGAVGIASGVVFGVLTLGKRSDIDNACGGNVGACGAPAGSLDADRQSAKTTATISTASFIVGGLALIGGGILYFTAPSSSSGTGNVKVTPGVATNGASIEASGTW